MKRLIFVTLAFLVGCNGMGSGSNRFLPAGPGESTEAAAAAGADSMPAARRGKKTKVEVTMTIPKRHRRDRVRSEHPATISPLTQSVSIAINGGGAHVFNATPSSTSCHIVTSGTVCTFVVDAPVGSDTFAIATFSGASGGGSRLDQGSAVFNVVKGKNNTPSIRLGPVVSSTADSGVGSLRYAIGAANAGDTIMLMLPAGSTIAVTTPLTISNRVSIAGPGVSASARHRDAHPDATYAGVSISGNGTQQMFSIQAGATVTISGLILTSGNATVAPGGAISNLGTLTLASDVLTGNTTTITSPLSVRAPHTRRHAGKHPHADPAIRHPHCAGTYVIGGAVYNNATLIVSGTTFDGNAIASDISSCVYGTGGAVFNDIHGTFLSTGNLYTNNSAYLGGAVFNYSEYGQASFTSDTFKANTGCSATSGCPTTGCTTTCTSYAQGYGAAIYDDYGPGVTITGSVFQNNVAGGSSPEAYGEGGALFLEEGSPSITNSSFTGNVAGGGSSNYSEGYAGAIYWCGSSQGMQINNDTFTSNVAGGDEYGEGGAIESCEPLSGSNDIFTSNVALGSGSAQYEDGYAEGGAIYQDDGLALSNSTFSKNVVSGAYEAEGGAIFSDEPASLTNDTFTSNVATANGATGSYSYAYGGAIYNDYGPLRLSNDSFTSNKASVTGPNQEEAFAGAVYNDGSSGMTSVHDTYASNAATATAGSSVDVYGGAVLSYEPLSSSFDSFTSNSATGPYESYGGAIYSEDSTTTFNNATIASNVASSPYEGYGGGIYDDDGLTINGSVISGNTATQRAGGLFIDDTETIANTSFTGNKVTGGGYADGGGAIYNDGSLTLYNSTISGNSATVSGTYAGGGGIYSDDYLAMTASTVSGNAVLGSPPSGSGGGGIFNYDQAVLVESTVSVNSSSADGGGLLNYSSEYLTNATIFANKAAASGGNASNASTMALANSIVAGGSASIGADISNSSTLASLDYNIIQTPVAGTPISGTTTHNLQVNPLLLALANNGGPTFTNADQANSPGRADIPIIADLCNGLLGTDFDQRGFARGAGNQCDVGAYEFAGVASAGVHRQPIRALPGHHRHPKQKRRPHAKAPVPAAQ
jgi:predicted outer membrane repeat protein